VNPRITDPVVAGPNRGLPTTDDAAARLFVALVMAHARHRIVPGDAASMRHWSRSEADAHEDVQN